MTATPPAMGSAEGGGGGKPGDATAVSGALVDACEDFDDAEVDNCEAIPTVAPMTNTIVAKPARMPTHVSGCHAFSPSNGSMPNLPLSAMFSVHFPLLQ